LGANGIHPSLIILHLHLSRLIVEDFDAIRHLSSKLNEFLVSRIFVYVVVAVFFILKLNYETVG
jgi:abortive infection bacteriophage resistance protein